MSILENSLNGNLWKLNAMSLLIFIVNVASLSRCMKCFVVGDIRLLFSKMVVFVLSVLDGLGSK